MFSEATGKSARTEVLLDLQAMAGWGDPALTKVRGSGALRVGKWKLLHGHTAVWKKPNNMASECTAVVVWYPKANGSPINRSSVDFLSCAQHAGSIEVRGAFSSPGAGRVPP